MFKILLKIHLLVVMLFFYSSAFAESQAISPLPMLEETAKQIITTLKANKIALKRNPEIIDQAIRQYLLPKVDVNGMARSVLGRSAWTRASTLERQQFVNAFTQLVIRTYASPLSEYHEESITFFPIRGSLTGRFLQVHSRINRVNGQSVPLKYSLISKNGHWKIYDFSVEGVSLLQSFRNQFAGALKNTSMQEIIGQLHRQSQKKRV